jgi:1-acyl-sn-glycerol-3-phosphate acyltransferase
MSTQTTDQPSFVYRATHIIMRFLLRLLSHWHVEGTQNLPRTGAAILVTNHLHRFDAVVVAAMVPRQVTTFAADKYQHDPLFGTLLRLVGHPIWVARGEPDRHALKAALAALELGALLGVAPEGTRSTTGALQQGHDGAAYLAGRAGVPVVPMVMWGQEQALSQWRRLRRPHIYAVVGQPIVLPPEAQRARTAQLAVYTEQIMHTMAAMMPEAYRGVYR